MNGCAIRTVVKLFDRLELQPTETASEEESDHTAARHFNRYFNFLYKMSKWPEGLVSETRNMDKYYIEDSHEQDDGVSEHTTFSQVCVSPSVNPVFLTISL